MKNCGNIQKNCALAFWVGVWYAWAQKSAHPFKKTADPLRDQKLNFLVNFAQDLQILLKSFKLVQISSQISLKSHPSLS